MESSAPAATGVRTWRWLLPALCAVATFGLFAAVIDVSGWRGTPWFGYWDSVTVATEQPYVAKITQLLPRGAAATSGFRDGDQIDVRDLNALEREGLLYQPVAEVALPFVVRRGDRKLVVTLHASTQYDANPLLKLSTTVVWVIADLWALACAWILALRRWNTREGRYLCLALLAIAFGFASPEAMAVPNGVLGALQLAANGFLTAALALLPVGLAATFGVRSTARTVAEAIAAIAAAATFGASVFATVGILNASIDPIPFAFGTFWRVMNLAIYGFAAIAVAMAVASTPRIERARAAWLLLPIPLAELLSTAAGELTSTAPTWASYMAWSTLSNAFVLAGAAAVTYALLKRRVLDFQLVLSRTLVVAGVSAIVVVSFVLLEFLLNTVLSNVSHATGLVANAGLALVLGLSMSFIHKRVDAFVDFAFFHKRHEDERALRDFAKEAAFVTQRDDLLDRAIENVRVHTDASAASVFLDGGGAFRAARWFGEAPCDVGENDAAVLAMKAKHSPVDPHRYLTAFQGDVAVPMLARGHLLGVLLCGPRAAGEAYTPDDLEALDEFAHGIGSALDSIDRAEGTVARDDAILSELRALRVAVERGSAAPQTST